MACDKDDFWDIAALLPPKSKKRAPIFADEIKPAVVTVDGEPQNELQKNERRLAFAESVEKETISYAFPDNPFIEKVSITKIQTLHLFLGFKNDAVALLEEKGKPCPFAPFFSYIPQIYQLNAAQKAYYLYFRDEANDGRYIDTNQSYFLLYVYEIINLPDHISPKLGMERLVKAWLGCRERIPAIDKFMVRWVADYGLLHGISCPVMLLRPYLKEILSLSAFKEFYLSDLRDSDDAQMDAILTMVSDYDPRKSRYAQDESGELLLLHVGRAARIVLRDLMASRNAFPSYDKVQKRYEAFGGALNATEERYEIAVTYFSVNSVDGLRLTMTTAVKYAENKVRAVLSIKSRLSAAGLPERYRQMIDSYFAKNFTKKTVEKDRPRPEYEALYDAAEKGISADAAKAIEASSWENTWRLVPEEEREELVEKEMPIDIPQKEEALLSVDEREILKRIFDEGESAALAYAKEKGLVLINACERINEAFMDCLGDIVLAIDGDGVQPIADYETEVQTFLSSAECHEYK